MTRSPQTFSFGVALQSMCQNGKSTERPVSVLFAFQVWVSHAAVHVMASRIDLAADEEQPHTEAAKIEVDDLQPIGHASRWRVRQVTGLDGTVFALPVDHEHKATEIRIPYCGNPHMRAFHASWLGFFSTFFSTFAPAPLAPVLMSRTTLGLTRNQIADGNILAVTSNIICRLIMGVVCDKIGARRGLAFLLLITAPAVLGLAFVQDAASFVACRFFIGMSLASFVACQVWCTQQFSSQVVGVANATAGGWGNLGGGVTTLLMGQIFLAFKSATGQNDDLSWRLCMIVPFALHVLSALNNAYLLVCAGLVALAPAAPLMLTVSVCRVMSPSSLLELHVLFLEARLLLLPDGGP